MQDGHGRWNDLMAEVMSVGTVLIHLALTNQGNIMCSYNSVE